MQAHLEETGLAPGAATVRAAALRHWAAWRGLPMPDVHTGAEHTRPRAARALVTTGVLRSYHVAVEACTYPAARAVLHVLPKAGMKLVDLCAAPREGQDTWRASRWLQDYVPFLDAGPWLFPSLTDPSRSVHPNEVRDQLAALRLDASWTPDVLARAGRELAAATGAPPAGPSAGLPQRTRAPRTSWTG